MIVMAQYCPRCGDRLVSNNAVIPEQVVVACKGCERFALESDTHWVVGSDEQVVSQLTTRLEDLERHHQAMHSDDSDPRWTQF